MQGKYPWKISLTQIIRDAQHSENIFPTFLTSKEDCSKLETYTLKLCKNFKFPRENVILKNYTETFLHTKNSSWQGNTFMYYR